MSYLDGPPAPGHPSPAAEFDDEQPTRNDNKQHHQPPNRGPRPGIVLLLHLWTMSRSGPRKISVLICQMLPENEQRNRIRTPPTLGAKGQPRTRSSSSRRPPRSKNHAANSVVPGRLTPPQRVAAHFLHAGGRLSIAPAARCALPNGRPTKIIRHHGLPAGPRTPNLESRAASQELSQPSVLDETAHVKPRNCPARPAVGPSSAVKCFRPSASRNPFRRPGPE